jgi:hypothetical protein
MPIYIFQHPVTKKYKEIVQSIHAEHIYIDENGFEWQRVFTAPQLNTEGTLGAECTKEKFSEFTKSKKGTIGDLWDRSKELSEKRRKIYGADPVKKEFKEQWSKKRKGKKLKKYE